MNPCEAHLFRPLSDVRQTEPANKHDHKQSNGDRVQHESSYRLCQDTRSKRSNRTSRASKSTDDAQATDLILAANSSRENRRRTRIHRAQQKAHDRNGHGITDDVGHLPDEKLEYSGADYHTVDESLLADFVGRVSEYKASEGDTAPESSGDISHG